MDYAIQTVAAPAKEPMALADAKAHIRFPFDLEDATIASMYIPAARARVEAELGRQLINATLALKLGGFPCGGQPILIPRAPLVSVSAVRYLDTAGEEQTIDAADYVVDTASEPGRVIPAANTIWPTTQAGFCGHTVTVEFVAGYGDNPADVPGGIREAIALLLGHYFYHREAVTMGGSPSELPEALSNILAAHSIGDEFTEYGVA